MQKDLVIFVADAFVVFTNVLALIVMENIMLEVKILDIVDLYNNRILHKYTTSNVTLMLYTLDVTFLYRFIYTLDVTLDVNDITVVYMLHIPVVTFIGIYSM